MNKIHIQNLVAYLDLCVSKGLVHPDDLINAGLSRKAALEIINTLEDGQNVVPEKKEQPSEAKLNK